jgi:carbonic anhydrase/acetyltransferase-like protein (isoleucine patch superfamily)
MDNVELGDESFVGALSLIKEGEKIPRRSLLAGNPARIIKEVSDEMIAWKTEGTKLYQALPAQMFESWKETAPLHEPAASIHQQAVSYKSWKDQLP